MCAKFAKSVLISLEDSNNSIIHTYPSLTVDADELFVRLFPTREPEAKAEDWVKEKIKEGTFLQGIDYLIVETPNLKYHLSIEMALVLCHVDSDNSPHFTRTFQYLSMKLRTFLAFYNGIGG